MVERQGDPSNVILVLPGGGYGGHADHEGEPVAEWLRSLGWRADVVRYPVLTKHPAPLLAVREAVAAERREGASLVGVIGFSAGGHLAGLAALAPGADADERLDFAILCYPVVSMLEPSHLGSRVNLLGIDASVEALESTSLDLLVTPTAPPLFVWHTADDPAVTVDGVYRLGSSLAAARVPHEVHVFESGEHGLGLAPGHPAEAWTDACAAWLDARIQR